jgi:hypothetical protein
MFILLAALLHCGGQASKHFAINARRFRCSVPLQSIGKPQLVHLAFIIPPRNIMYTLDLASECAFHACRQQLAQPMHAVVAAKHAITQALMHVL